MLVLGMIPELAVFIHTEDVDRMNDFKKVNKDQ